MKQKLTQKPLETERLKFLFNINELVNCNVENELPKNGRPPFNKQDVVKALAIQCLNGTSYRRSKSDLMLAKSMGFIQTIPTKTTLSKYMKDKSMIALLQDLIQISASHFLSSEDTLIVDSTWFNFDGTSGGHKNKPFIKKNPNFDKCRKLHVGILKNSKIICCAIPTDGRRHDCPLFEPLVTKTVQYGFFIKKCLGDKGYFSKYNYELCESLGINAVFLDFKSHVTGKKGKSIAYNKAYEMYSKRPEEWHETYRYRVLVESVFSAIKRKFLNWLRTRNDTARDNEMLLKALCYNIMVIGRYE